MTEIIQNFLQTLFKSFRFKVIGSASRIQDISEVVDIDVEVYFQHQKIDVDLLMLFINQLSETNSGYIEAIYTYREPQYNDATYENVIKDRITRERYFAFSPSLVSNVSLCQELNAGSLIVISFLWVSRFITIDIALITTPPPKARRHPKELNEKYILNDTYAILKDYHREYRKDKQWYPILSIMLQTIRKLKIVEQHYSMHGRLPSTLEEKHKKHVFLLMSIDVFIPLEKQLDSIIKNLCEDFLKAFDAMRNKEKMNVSLKNNYCSQENGRR